MECFSYIVTRDYGFAPNPFHGYCTLATCKPAIRNKAKIDDWVVGFASRSLQERKVVYLMKVDEKMDYEEYWNEERFQIKKSNMKASLVKAYGDNIYHMNEENTAWIQADSHHSYENGEINLINYKNDTSSKFVLISKNFYYFGRNPIVVPPGIDIDRLIIKRGNTRVRNEVKFLPLIEWVEDNYKKNYVYSDPKKFDIISRYSGK